MPQRLIFSGIDATTGNVHSLTFSHEATKSGIHAYDFTTSWEQAQAAAKLIDPENDLLQYLNTCGDSIHATAYASCQAIETAGFGAFADVPDDMGPAPSVPDGNVNLVITNYETEFGNRQVRIAGNADVSAASMSFDGYTSSGGSDYAHYTLTWTSASTDIRIELAGHLSVGEDPLEIGVGYGSGLGSSTISGGPHHISLSHLDGASLGSQDNQIKGADILLPPPVVECDVSPNPTKVGHLTDFTASASGGVPPYSWSWTVDGTEVATTQNTTYTFDTDGTYAVCVTVTDELGNVEECCKEVTVNPALSLECDVSPNPTKVGHLTDFTASASGGVGSYTWSWTVAGVEVGTTEDMTYDFTSEGPGTYDVCVTVT
ncbi:MAG: PKD domain-containing protein, partial [Methanophagales archaeon]|nr:PKD domain-containing protein [Methanophagales archaeon]